MCFFLCLYVFVRCLCPSFNRRCINSFLCICFLFNSSLFFLTSFQVDEIVRFFFCCAHSARIIVCVLFLIIHCFVHCSMYRGSGSFVLTAFHSSVYETTRCNQSEKHARFFFPVSLVFAVCTQHWLLSNECAVSKCYSNFTNTRNIF